MIDFGEEKGNDLDGMLNIRILSSNINSWHQFSLHFPGPQLYFQCLSPVSFYEQLCKVNPTKGLQEGPPAFNCFQVCRAVSKKMLIHDSES